MSELEPQVAQQSDDFEAALQRTMEGKTLQQPMEAEELPVGEDPDLGKHIDVRV